MKYLNKTPKRVSHYWDDVNQDTYCTMWSTKGITNKSKYFVADEAIGKKICHQCQSVMNKKRIKTRMEKRNNIIEDIGAFNAE